MVVYYRGLCALITHEVFVVHCPTHQQFALRDLTHLRVIEQEADPPAVNAIRTGSTSVAGAVAIALGAGPVLGTQVYESPLMTLGLLAVLVLAIAVTGACWRPRTARYALVAAYRGRWVTLFRSTDEREFGQVKRALIRALQHLEDTR